MKRTSIALRRTSALHRTVPAGLAAALVLGTACSDASGPGGPDAMLDLTVAAVAGEAVARDLELMHGPGGLHGFGFAVEVGRFRCEGGARHGLTVTRTCTFRDADGNEQPAYDDQTTASVETHFEVSGELNRGPMKATIADVRDMIVTGLLGTETQRTWNGTGSGTSTRVRPVEGSDPVEYTMTHEVAVDDVVIPVPRSWPLSGTITKHFSVTVSGGPRDGTTRTRDVIITFNGTPVVTVTVNGEAFEVDLAARGLPHRKGR